MRQGGRFGSKVGQIGPKWDKSGAISDQFSVHLAPNPGLFQIRFQFSTVHLASNALISNLKKLRICPIWG